jgi:hypothetical protein
MATPAERATAILNALVDGTATVGQRQRVLATFGDAETLLRVVRRTIKQRILRTEESAARAALPPPADFNLGDE